MFRVFAVHLWMTAIKLTLKRDQQLAGFIPGKNPKKEGQMFYF